MMSKDFERILGVLYEEIGDIGVEFVKNQGAAFIKGQMSARTATPASGGHAPTGGNPELTEDSSPNMDGDREGVDGGTPAGGPANEGSIYDDADRFETAVGNHMGNLAGVAIQNPADVVAVVEDMVHMAGEVRKFEEAQITRRLAIAADRDVAVARIKAQQEFLRDYLARSFDERAENFSRLFAVVDGALETNNMQALAMGLDSVVKLAASSPFKDLGSIEETAVALNDPDHEWDF